MSKGSRPSRVIVRFYYENHDRGMTLSALGSYYEVDVLMSPSQTTRCIAGYQSVLIITELDVDLAWLKAQPYVVMVEYDGKTVYIHSHMYREAYEILRNLVADAQRRQDQRRKAKAGARQAPFPGKPSVDDVSTP